jgi:hypothetical protein
MDLCLTLPLIIIGLLAFWALIVKMVDSKDRRDDDDLPPTGGVSDLDIANATTILVNAV